MHVEQNLRLIDTFDEAFNSRDWKRLLGVCSDSIVIHDPYLREPVKGRAEVEKLFQNNVEAFPDARIEKVWSFGQGDLVCSENVEKGSQKSTNRSYRITTCYVFKIEGGEITELRFYYDALGMMNQLGLSPKH